jgi:hypothetical protein
VEALTRSSPTARQVSAYDPENRFIVSVLAKRTYHIEPNGRCVPAEEQMPLVNDVRNDPQCPGLLAHDCDLFAFKLATDVILRGHAYSRPPCPRFEASLKIGKVTRSILVQGERKCQRSAGGCLTFSEPKPIERVPLRYDKAYGGRDVAMEAKYGNPYLELGPYVPANWDLGRASPYLYPRNPCGVGYLIEPTPEAVEQVTLPNLEDPADPLTPERLVVGQAGQWPCMPTPQAFDWINYGWFPRLAYVGVVPRFDSPRQPVPEVARGLAPADILQAAPQFQKFDFRFANGASPGLQLPYLRGDESCLLINLHPREPRFGFQLPGDVPRISTDGRNGKLNKTTPVLHTLLMEPDESRLTVVWRGSSPALRLYTPLELEAMPFRVEW